jgi:phage replication initiation protein
MAGYVGELPAWKLTRVDLAVDLHEGEYSIDDAHTWALEGRFVNGGRPPALDCQGDWILAEHGRTLNVGKREHGKMLCIYEKGKQLGDLSSPWVRWEARFGCRDRELPLSILTERDSFFAGAYPALQEILGVVGERIKTIRETSRTTIEKAMEHMARSYGGYLHVLSEAGVESADLVESMTVRVVPRRLDIASLADAGLSATVHAVISGRMFNHERHDDRDGAGRDAVFR